MNLEMMKKRRKKTKSPLLDQILSAAVASEQPFWTRN